MAIDVKTAYEEAERPSLVLPGSENVTREELIQRARAMVPVLRERAQRCEEARRMLPETLDDFKRNGFFRICQPKRFGGFEMGFDVLEEVLIELARGCGSSAWTLGILSGHAWFSAGFSLDGQRELYGDDGHAIVSTTLGGRGTARKVEGGLRISGRYAVQSGCDVATFHAIGTYLEDGDGSQETGYFCAIRPSQATIVDNWYVLGMRGTGSKSVVVEDAFVPDHLTLWMPRVNDQDTPGSHIHPNPLYRAPWRAFVFIEITGTAVGLALQGVEILDDILRTKPIRIAGQPLHGAQMELPLSRRRLAEAKSLATAARDMLLTDARRLVETTHEYVAQGRKFSVEECMEYALNCAKVVDLCVQSVDHAFAGAGTSGAYAGQPMERCLRDVKMMSTHGAYRFDLASERWSMPHFGL